jgi:protein-S-isoprenylcysteine O-methyltransferase Ste14
VDDPLSPSQLASWVFLVYSIYLIIASFPLLRRSGEPHPDREDPALFHFEKTTRLVTHGIFRYIRHPMYGSLIFLTIGAYLKHPMTWLNSLVCLAAIIMYYISSLREEEENTAYFGEEYCEYIKTSRMYIPFIF